MSIYDRGKALADRLLAADKFGALTGAGTTAISLHRKTETPAANAWDDPVITTTTEGLKAQAFGVSSDLVGTPAAEPDGPVVLASDRMVIAALPVMGYRAGDILTIDGAPVTILRVWNIPAAGVRSAVKFLVR